MQNELPEASWKERVLFFLGRRTGFPVKGNSMLPTLKDGDVVLIDPEAKIEAGDIILINQQYEQNIKMLKRISKISNGNVVLLTEDNPNESFDSRSCGEISKKDVLGKVTCRLK